jgi:hypothetical protein
MLAQASIEPAKQSRLRAGFFYPSLPRRNLRELVQCIVLAGYERSDALELCDPHIRNVSSRGRRHAGEKS